MHNSQLSLLHFSFCDIENQIPLFEMHKLFHVVQKKLKPIVLVRHVKVDVRVSTTKRGYYKSLGRVIIWQFCETVNNEKMKE